MEPQTAPLFTVVCVSHRPEMLENWLLPSVRSQTAPYELRIVDSRNGAFRSCAAALNAGASDAQGRYILFVHHDVAWDSPGFLTSLAHTLDGLSDLGAVGAIGSMENPPRRRYRLRGSILAGPRPGRLDGLAITAPVEVQTVDEMLLIVPNEVFRQLPFDDRTCDDWHLYSVDYCLSIRARGLKIYAVPMSVRHLSPGTLDRGYFHTLAKLCRKHKAMVPWIYTTCDPWITSGPAWLNPALYQVRHQIRNVKGAILQLLIRLRLRRPRQVESVVTELP